MPLHNSCDLKLLIIVYACIRFLDLLTEEGGTLEPSKILNEKNLPLNYKKSSAILMVFIYYVFITNRRDHITYKMPLLNNIKRSYK